MFRFLFGRRKKKKREETSSRSPVAPELEKEDIPEPGHNLPLRPREVVFNPFGRFAEAVKTSVQDIHNPEEIDDEQLLRQRLSGIGVVAFIGPSGTGKSTRAIMVAKEYDIGYIIDDGLLIRGSSIVAGTSAKKAPTKMESVRQALFADPTRAANMRRALAEHLPPSLMILGTSDGMLYKICNNLWLNQPTMLIRIEDITTEDERSMAKHTRMTQGKHTIPVPSMEIKHEFSGYLAEPIQKLKRKFDRSGHRVNYNDGERTVVRPTFSTLGNYSLSDEALAMLCDQSLREIDGIAAMLDFNVIKETYGVMLNIQVALVYGYNAPEVLQSAQAKLSRDIERFTAINVLEINMRAVRVVHDRRLAAGRQPREPLQ